MNEFSKFGRCFRDPKESPGLGDKGSSRRPIVDKHPRNRMSLVNLADVSETQKNLLGWVTRGVQEGQ